MSIVYKIESFGYEMYKVSVVWYELRSIAVIVYEVPVPERIDRYRVTMYEI